MLIERINHDNLVKRCIHLFWLPNERTFKKTRDRQAVNPGAMRKRAIRARTRARTRRSLLEWRFLSLTDELVANTYAILEHRRRDDQTIYERQQRGLVILGRRFLQLVDHDSQSITLALPLLRPNISLMRCSRASYRAPLFRENVSRYRPIPPARNKDVSHRGGFLRSRVIRGRQLTANARFYRRRALSAPKRRPSLKFEMGKEKKEIKRKNVVRRRRFSPVERQKSRSPNRRVNERPFAGRRDR